MSRTAFGTWAGVALTAAAVIVPSTAWWWAGTSEAQRRAERSQEDAVLAARAEADALAGRLASRMARLLDVENRRPFWHYLPSPTSAGAVDGAAVAWRSPLTAPPADPLVLCYFQADTSNRVSLPILEDERHDVLDVVEARRACVARDALAGSAAQFVAVVRPECTDTSATAASPTEAAPMACVGPLMWRTLDVGGIPSLLALRWVETPDRFFTQGFMVDLGELGPWLSSAAGRASLEPGVAQVATESTIPMLGTEWHVAVDATPALARATTEALRARGEFLRLYVLLIGIAATAGLAAAALAWKASRLAQRRSEFAAVAAHELRTPLAGLRLYGGMLARGLGDAGSAKRHAQRISDEADRLGRVVGNLLSFTLHDRGDLVVRPEPGDLGAAVTDRVAALGPALATQGATVELDVEHGLPAARFDGEALAHVLQNLLDNAEKYSRGCSDRTISVRLRASADSRALTLSVDDAGPGIPPSLRQRVFEPFARVRKREGPEGLGLGLALSRSLAQACGGNLSCGDGPRGGACFTLVVPVAPAAEVPVTEPVPAR